MKNNVLFLCGGRSDEHEISLISTKHVLKALDRTRFHPLVVGISKSGAWHWVDEENFLTGEIRADRVELDTSLPTVQLTPFQVDRQGQLHVDGQMHAFDIVFPVLHGPYGEDGTLQGLLDILDVPYVGSNCGSSWICMDKHLSKTLCQNLDIPTANFVCLNSPSQISERKHAIEKLGLPLFVKPSRTGSSVGITKVKTLEALPNAVDTAFRYDSKCLIEEAIQGREIECAVLGLNKKPEVAVPGEIIPAEKVGFYSYEAKYLMDDGAKIQVPADLPPDTIKRIQDFSLNVFHALECDGMARVDIFLKPSGDILLNEVNTIPGFTPISMYPKMWEASGLSYQKLVSRLLELALERSQPR